MWGTCFGSQLSCGFAVYAEPAQSNLFSSSLHIELVCFFMGQASTIASRLKFFCGCTVHSSPCKCLSHNGAPITVFCKPKVTNVPKREHDTLWKVDHSEPSVRWLRGPKVSARASYTPQHRQNSKSS
jgi:hypothetical protein